MTTTRALIAAEIERLKSWSGYWEDQTSIALVNKLNWCLSLLPPDALSPDRERVARIVRQKVNAYLGYNVLTQDIVTVNQLADEAANAILTLTAADPIPIEREGWRPISDAPADDTVVIVRTEGGHVFLARFSPFDDGFAWQVDSDLCPPCWTDGVCWASNESEEPSDPPVFWMPNPVISAAPVLSGRGEEDHGS